MPDTLHLCDVSPRDGLQNEKNEYLTTDDKLLLIDKLVAAGIDTMEVTAFVNPKAVPMMADATQVMQTVRERHPQLHAMALIFNERGYRDAIAAGAEALSLVFIVPDGLSQSNTGRAPDEWLSRQLALAQQAADDDVWLRVYLAGAWICPFDGAVAPQQVLDYAAAFAEIGVDEFCPTDPIGQAHPAQVKSLLTALAEQHGAEKLAVHLHDTQGFGAASAYAALEAGVRTVDGSIGGLGGCPFAPGAAGNLATEDIVLLAHNMGYETSIALDALHETVTAFEPVIGRKLGGRSRDWYLSQQTAATTDEG